MSIRPMHLVKVMGEVPRWNIQGRESQIRPGDDTDVERTMGSGRRHLPSRGWKTTRSMRAIGASRNGSALSNRGTERDLKHSAGWWEEKEEMAVRLASWNRGH